MHPVRGACAEEFQELAAHEPRFSGVRAVSASLVGRPRERGSVRTLGAGLLVAAFLSSPAFARGSPEPASAPSARAPRLSSPLSLYRPGNAPPLVRTKPASPAAPAVDPEARARGTVAKVWLNRPFSELGGPERLSVHVAARLRSTARATGVDWALLLGVLRAGHPSRPDVRSVGVQLRQLGARGDARRAVLAILKDRTLADRALALAGYYRAVGLDSLVSGLDAEKGRLIGLLLMDRRVDLDLVGEEDIIAGRIDVRVVASLLYLAGEYGQVRVSSLLADRHVVRPGVSSAHLSGLAFDVSALGRRPLFGRPRLVARAASSFLLLPSELRPQQLVSVASERNALLASGERPDHLHVGF